MDSKKKRYNLYTLDGKALLNTIKAHYQNKKTASIHISDGLIQSLEEHQDSAFFYQLMAAMEKEHTPHSSTCFTKVYLYVDFASAFPLQDRTAFDILFEEGFQLDFDDGTPMQRFVPILTSQSQSKKCVFSFVREDLFAPLQKRLNLDIDLENNAGTKGITYLPKLYAYRALYLSSATEVLHFNDEGGADFFNCDSIIILPDKKHDPTVSVFTANPLPAKNGEVVLEQNHSAQDEKVEIDCFDGEGIVSPAFSQRINDLLPANMRGTSFQVRMPFLKGVLHEVDFHTFLQKHGIEKDATVTDIFGCERDLFKAQIIVRASMFKLRSLLPKETDDCAAFCRQYAPDGDIMRYYFSKMQQYNHGLYVTKTNASFHNTQYVRLSAQQLSTLNLSREDLDGMVADHLALADTFCAQHLTDPANWEMLAAMEDKTDWMNLLLQEPRLLNDPHIKAAVNTHRVSLYNAIAQGRLLVPGEIRFLSGDLYVFLLDLLERANYDKGDLIELKKNRLQRDGVYMPGASKTGRKVALLRSPHLSRNEDVCTILCKDPNNNEDPYNCYLGHLKGVIITGDTSYIPAALGGADFDGDTISVIYDERIINACYNGGYREIYNQDSPVPFIHIKPLAGGGGIAKYTYVSPQVIYNTFSSRIGQISNAAMKIAAVEYDAHLAKNDSLPHAALCTILTGNEIDGTKKGVRPHIDTVLRFSQDLDDDSKYVVKEIDNYIKMKNELESLGGIVQTFTKEENVFTLDKKSPLPVKEFSPNCEHNAVAQLLYRWAEAFYNAKETGKTLSSSTPKLTQKSAKVLSELFPEQTTNGEACEQIMATFKKASTLFASSTKQRNQAHKKASDNEAKITVRLHGQYDDIYAQSNTHPSYKERFAYLQSEIHALSYTRDYADIDALSSQLFTIAKEKFNTNTFWPYSQAGDVSVESDLLAKILQLPYADMLQNFDYEGYRLLYYALDNAKAKKLQEADDVITTEDNPYFEKYRNLYRNMFADYAKRATFDKALIKMAQQDLAEAEGLDPNEEDTPITLIRRLYPPQAEEINIFWNIFTEKQMMHALGGDVDAE